MSFWQAKTIVKSLMKNMKPVIFLVLFAYVIALAPDKLFVTDSYQNRNNVVRAAYEQMLLESTKNNTNWSSIAFDSMIVDVDNGKSAITYAIAPGDTLESIASQFWTTVEELHKTNDISDPNSLRTGTKLVISYTEGVPYVLPTTQTIAEFTQKHGINREDFMAINYFDDKDMPLDEGRQVILPLNELEAEKKWLLPKEEFVMLALQEPEVVAEPELPVEEVVEPEVIEPEESAPTPWQDTGYTQTIITAEQTQEHLENLKKQQEEERKQRELAAAQVIEQKEQQPQNTGWEKPAPEVLPTQPSNPCKENQCFFNSQCRSKPENSVCTPNDTKNAWACMGGFTENGKKCVPVPKQEAPAAVAVVQPQPQVAAAPAVEAPAVVEKPVVKAVAKWERTILAQRYSNYTAMDDFVPSGFARGHCTEAAAYYRYKNHGINIRTAWKWGNAIQRTKRAEDAGYVVNNTPAVGAIMITNIGGGYSKFGHAAYVTEVDRDNGVVKIIDQNYVGRHITTEQLVPIDEAISYIHPTKE